MIRKPQEAYIGVFTMLAERIQSNFGEPFLEAGFVKCKVMDGWFDLTIGPRDFHIRLSDGATDTGTRMDGEPVAFGKPVVGH